MKVVILSTPLVQILPTVEMKQTEGIDPSHDKYVHNHEIFFFEFEKSKKNIQLKVFCATYASLLSCYPTEYIFFYKKTHHITSKCSVDIEEEEETQVSCLPEAPCNPEGGRGRGRR